VRWRELQGELAASLGTNESRIVLEEVSGRRYRDLYRYLDGEATPDAVDRARALAARRCGGEPLQRVVGHWSFRGLELVLDGRALVPRPETETVVDHVLSALRDRHAARPLVVDLGTGSGAIALAVACEVPDALVIATDRSFAALGLAAENRDRLGTAAARVRLVCGDWYAPFGPALAGRVDVVVSNPPYLSLAEWETTEPVVREWDPPDALIGGEEGIEAIGEVVAGAPGVLGPGGTLVVEIGATEGAAVMDLAAAAGARRIAVEPDLAGRDRILVASW